MAIPVGAGAGNGGIEFLVMHPAHVLESRASNVDGLPNYRSPQGLKQLRASVVCAREFARDLLDEGHVRDVLRLNERVFRFSLRGHGLGVWMRDQISTFEAVLLDPRLPAGFVHTRYPRMLQELQRHRDKAVVEDKKRGSAMERGSEGPARR